MPLISRLFWSTYIWSIFSRTVILGRSVCRQISTIKYIVSCKLNVKKTCTLEDPKIQLLNEDTLLWKSKPKEGAWDSLCAKSLRCRRRVEDVKYTTMFFNKLKLQLNSLE